MQPTHLIGMSKSLWIIQTRVSIGANLDCYFLSCLSSPPANQVLNRRKMQDNEIPFPDASDPKEIYAFYGLTMYTAQVFEKGLLNLVVVCKMLAKQGATRQCFSNLFEAFERKTLGQLLYVARSQVHFDESVEEKLHTALKRRNFLAHQYFWDNAQEMMSNAGRLELMMVLREDIRLFQVADSAVDSIFISLRQKLGITDEILEKAFSEIKKEAESRDKTDQ